MALPLISGSPGIRSREDNIATQSVSLTTTTGAMVVALQKGTLSPYLTTSLTEFSSMYGKSNTAWSYGVLTANAFYSRNPDNPLYTLRVVNTDAKYAVAKVFVNYYNQPGIIALNGAKNPAAPGNFNVLQINLTSLVPNSTTPLSSSASTVGTLNLSGPTGNKTVILTAITGLTNITTLNSQLASLINGALLTNYGASAATVGAGFIGKDATTTYIVLPEGVSCQLSLVITGNTGTGVNTSTTGNNPSISDSTVLDIYAENPGAWGNDLAVNINSIDKGSFQVYNIQFQKNASASTFFNQGMIINLIVSYNGSTFTVSDTYDSATFTNDDNFFQRLASDLLQSIYNVSLYASTVSVNTIDITGKVTNTNISGIQVVAGFAGPNIFSLSSTSNAVGTAKPSFYGQEISKGVASTGNFNINVYSRNNLAQPIETFTVNLNNKIDNFGKQLQAATVINTFSGGSFNIRVAVNAAAVANNVKLVDISNNLLLPIFLGGGSDGSIPTDNQIVNAWQIFGNSETYKVNTLIAAGYTSVSVSQAIADIASNRADCQACLDVPSNLQSPTAAASFVKTQLNIDTTYASINTPDLLVLDSDTNILTYVPMSGYTAAAFNYTDINYSEFEAPAGVKRGVLQGVQGARYTYSKADRDILDAANINFAKKSSSGGGYIIFNDKTLATVPSLLSALNIRRGITYIERQIVAILESNVFDLNNAGTDFIIKQKITNIIQPYVGTGVSKFAVITDSSINPAYVADAGQKNIAVYIKPVRAIRVILLDTIVTPSSVSFNELIVNGIL